MTIFIARDGAEIGECERQDLEQLAREGQVLATDHYWHEGMEGWNLLGDLVAADNWNTVARQAPRVLKPALVQEPIQSPERARAPERTVRIAVEPAAAAAPAKTYRDPKEFLRQRRKSPREPRKAGAPNTRLRAIAISVGVLLFVALGLYAIFAARAEKNARASALFPPTTKIIAQSADEIRDKAAAELKGKIDLLPAKPVPPLESFYYDVQVNMQKTLSTRIPWWAVIRGGENVIDPATEQTIVRTDFILTVEYRDGEWTFKRYRASASDMVKKETREIEEDEKTPMPPSIVGMLGLKMPPQE